MELREYIADTRRRNLLARATHVSPDWLYQVATNWRGKRASAELANRIDRATRGLVPKSTLRPDLYDMPALDDRHT